MRIALLLLTCFTLCLTSACNRDSLRFAEALVGTWEIVDITIVTGNSGTIDPGVAPGRIMGILTLTDCDGATNFNPCPATFTAFNGDVYEVEWAAALDFDGADRLELNFVGSPNDSDDDIIADLLNRPWNIDLREGEMDMELASNTQTGPALGFEPLEMGAVRLRKR